MRSFQLHHQNMSRLFCRECQRRVPYIFAASPSHSTIDPSLLAFGTSDPYHRVSNSTGTSLSGDVFLDLFPRDPGQLHICVSLNIAYVCINSSHARRTSIVQFFIYIRPSFYFLFRDQEWIYEMRGVNFGDFFCNVVLQTGLHLL
jgi:hypothetical protein